MKKNKRKNNIFFMGLLVLISIWVGVFPVQGAIPATERKALIALYNSTLGINWTRQNGWKTPPLHSDGFGMPGTEQNWYGIKVADDHVTWVEIMYNNLVGPIPPEIGDLSHLEVLMLADNYTLSGSIPREIGKLSNLVLFQASVNCLSGSIPREIGNLRNLKFLRLYANRLNGDIPPEIGNLTNLDDILMGANLLTGSIPASFGNLTQLRYLDFYANRLDGSLPKELGNLTNLIYLGLYWNRLRGEIPVTLVNLIGADIHLQYNALYTENETLRAFLNGKDPNWENSQTVAPANVTVRPLSQTAFNISWTPILYSGDDGGYRVYYRTPPANNWIYAGMTADKTVSNMEVMGLTAEQDYCFTVQTRTNPCPENGNTVDSLCSPEVCHSFASTRPFGAFDTPLDNTIVRSSIAVTGWALDDFAVDHVKIFREPVVEDGAESIGTLIFIGDADFVEGARPDVAITYPDYPNNTRAGWGYMMLTNMLPNGGNGTFKLHAIATDVEGNSTTLGIKTIVCDNIHAVKPFGAMDTPSQGGTASGHQFVNFGWVLTPLPNTIPTDGSTINVWVDGVLLGHPVYNQYRADIATLFPGYANSLGAVGYFFIDTTLYKNGGHTIQWTATDNAGNTDGIGSRYFTIQNAASDHATPSTDDDIDLNSDLPTISSDDSHPVRVKTGYSQDLTDQVIYPDQAGTPTIKIPQLSRVEIDLNEGSDVSSYQWRGYLQVGKQKQPLPIGATLDVDNGVFYWQPCAGFFGQYHLVFEGLDQTKGKRRVELTVKIINE